MLSRMLRWGLAMATTDSGDTVSRVGLDWVQPLVYIAVLTAIGSAARGQLPDGMCTSYDVNADDVGSAFVYGTTSAQGCAQFFSGDLAPGTRWVPSPLWEYPADFGSTCLFGANPMGCSGPWQAAWDWVLGETGGGRQYPLNVHLELGVAPAGLPPISYDVRSSSSPLVPPGGSAAEGVWRAPRVVAGSTVDAVTGMPLLREIDLELPFGSATYRHVRTYGQYHELRHEAGGGAAGEWVNEARWSGGPGGDYWDSNGAGWMMGEAPILLIDAHYMMLADVPTDDGHLPRRCIFIPDAHRAISFIQDEGSGEYVAPANADAALSHNGVWDSGDVNQGILPHWDIRPTVYRVWTYNKTVCYTIRALYHDVFPGFALTEEDRTCGATSNHDSPVADPYGDHVCFNGTPYYGLTERIDDIYGNCIDMQYCSFGAIDYMDHVVGEETCHLCRLNYNEKGQLARVRLISGATFDTTSGWNSPGGEWDVGNPGALPWDWAAAQEGSVQWTLLFTYRSFRRPYYAADYFNMDGNSVDEALVSIDRWYRSNAVYAIYVYEGEPDAATGPVCRSIDFTHFYGPAGGPGDGYWIGGEPDLEALEDLEIDSNNFFKQDPSDPDPEPLPGGWEYVIRYMYAEPCWDDLYRGNDNSQSESTWYDGAFGFACADPYFAPRLIKASVITRDPDGGADDSWRDTLYRYDSFKGTQYDYGLTDRMAETTLSHVYDNRAIRDALDRLNENAQTSWTVNHLLRGEGPDGSLLDDWQVEIPNPNGDGSTIYAAWDNFATRLMLPWNGPYRGHGTTEARSAGDWQAFETSSFATNLPNLESPDGDQTVGWKRDQTLFMVPGVAMWTERGIAGGDKCYRMYRFYVSSPEYEDYSDEYADDYGGGAGPFVRWNYGERAPFRSVLHVPYRAPRRDSGWNYDTVHGSDIGDLSRDLSQTGWLAVIDEYPSIAKAKEVAASWDWTSGKPDLRRIVWMNAAGYVLKEIHWTPQDGVTFAEGYTDHYVYDQYGRLVEHRTPGWSATPVVDNDERGLINVLAYFTPKDKNNNNQIDVDEVPQEIRARGVRRGTMGDTYWSELTERNPDRMDLVARVRKYNLPITQLPGSEQWVPGVDPTSWEFEYEFETDPDDDGTPDDAEDWVITLKTSLAPAIRADTTAEEYRGRETLVYDDVDDEDQGGVPGQRKRGRLRWRICGMEPVSGNSSAPSARRLFDYTYYDGKGRASRYVHDAAPGALLGRIQDALLTFGDQDGYVDEDAGAVPAYPLGYTESDRLAAGLDPANQLTKTWFGNYGPQIIEHPDGRQTQHSYVLHRDGSMEMITAQGLQKPTGGSGSWTEIAPNAPGLIRFADRNQLMRTLHVSWDWNTGDSLVNQDYEVITETEVGDDLAGRPTSATQTGWHGGSRKVQAVLDEYGSSTRRTEPDGTMTRTASDPRGRPERLYVGTADQHEFWGYSANGNDNLVLTEHRVYGSSTTDAGMQTHSRRFRLQPPNKYGDLSQDPYVGVGWLSETRYDWRMRPIWSATYAEGSDSTPLRHQITLYDHLDRVRFSIEYGTTAPEPSQDPAYDNIISFNGVDYDGRLSTPNAADILATNPQSLTETIYNAAGQVEEVRRYDPQALDDAEYLTTLAWFDRQGRETTRIEPSSAATITSYDTEGRVLTRRVVVDPAATEPLEITVTSYEYDEAGRLLVASTLERTHDDPITPQLTAGSNAIQTERWNWYDAEGRLTATASVGAGSPTSDAFVNTGTFPEYPASNGPAFALDGTISRGGVPGWAVLTCYRYDASGRRSRAGTQLTEDGSSGAPTYRIDRSYYDGLGNLVFSIENGGAVGEEVKTRTAYKYDPMTGQLTHIAAVLPGASLTSTAWPQDIELDPSVDPLSYMIPDWQAADGTLQTTQLEYGAEVHTGDGSNSQNNSWVGKVYLPDPTTGQPSATPSLTFTYYSDGLVRTRTDALGRTFTHTYDQFGRRTQTVISYSTHPMPAYKPVDLAVRLDYEYDDRDNLIHATAWGNDGQNDVIIADNTYTYDARGNLLAEQQSYGDAASPDPRLGDPRELVEYNWDYKSATLSPGNHNRLGGMTYPEKVQTGQRRTLAFVRGGTMSDPASAALHRITRVHDQLADVAADFSFAGIGRRVGTEVQKDLGSTPVTVWSQTFGAGGSAGYSGLNRQGRVQDLHFKDGAGTTLHQYLYGYNSAGNRLYTEAHQVGASNTRSWVYSYDALSRLRSAERGILNSTKDGIDYSEGNEPVRVAWGLDTLGNWTEGAGTDDGQGAFLYSGRVEEQRDLSGNYQLVLAKEHLTDLCNRLDGITTDSGGGPASVPFIYDAAGNLVADDTYWYQYDAFNRLASVHAKGSLNFDSSGQPTSGTPGAWKLYMAYDALGRLISVQKPWSAGNEHRKSFIYYDGVRRIMEVFDEPLLGAGAPIGGISPSYTIFTDREYVWGPGSWGYVNECLWQVTKTGNIMHVLQDASMDVVATLDSTGSVAQQWTYDPYGEPIINEQLLSSAHNRLGHHGLFFDRLDQPAPSIELVAGSRGLYYACNREYSAPIARWLQQDPFGTGAPLVTNTGWHHGRAPMVAVRRLNTRQLHRDGLNLYAYVGGEPLLDSDPLGLFSTAGLAPLAPGIALEIVMNAMANAAVNGALWTISFTTTGAAMAAYNADTLLMMMTDAGSRSGEWFDELFRDMLNSSPGGPQYDPDKMTTSENLLAQEWGVTVRQVSEGIHKLKQGGAAGGARSNPDLIVNRATGDAFIKGTVEYVGNLKEILGI